MINQQHVRHLEYQQRAEQELSAELMTGGGWCMYASANFEMLVPGCIKAEFCNQNISKYQIFIFSIDSFEIYTIFVFLHRSKLKRHTQN